MEPLVVTITHTLGKDELLRRLKPALGHAAEKYPAFTVEREDWDGDHMEFRVRAIGQTISGNIQVEEKSVRLEVVLPWFLARFSRVLQKTIEIDGRKLLGKKPDK